MEPRHVIVVGGGASGLVAAIEAARSGAKVLVLETGKKIGRSILASGNGRCNYTNSALSPSHFNDPDFVAPLLGPDATRKIVEYFEGIGLWGRPDGQGRWFPRSRSANSVLDVLLDELESLDVRIECDSPVRDVRPARAQAPRGRGGTGAGERMRSTSQSWEVVVEGETIVADALVWAAGGGSAEIPSACLGIRRVTERPVLCPLATDREAIRGLDGVRADCLATLIPRDGRDVPEPQFGEVLFRPYGISGIVTFDLSRHAQPGDTIELDFFGDLSPQDLEDRLSRQMRLGRPPQYLLDGILHPALARKLSPTADARSLAARLKSFRLQVKGTADESHAQVTRGGLANECFDPQTLACRGLPGFYACGESLDVDGACGGFNLSWAWLSGIAAGRSAGSRFPCA